MEVDPARIQLTDALRHLAAGGAVRGVVFRGLRHDTGDKAEYLRTMVRMACARPDLGAECTGWLTEFVTELGHGERGTRERERAA